MAEIEIEIDGKTLTVQSDQTVIQAADAADIYIPRFCYHKKLSIAANCRMCLVEVEKSPKLLPACATPVMPGMKVSTRSAKALAGQRSVMEFLLINHPLDCPICDQGGECELQDLSMGYGSSHSSYDECKRSVADQNLGPLIATEMTRCIACTRCVRYGDEISGFRELGALNRGEDTKISTYITLAMQSEVSGNIIDLCPVGALTSKPYRFKARAWELEQFPSISPHDCLGTNVNVHTRFGKVMRVVSRLNEDINEMWVADRDRFSYTGLEHADRLLKPMMRIDGKMQEVEWEKALEAAALKIQDAIAEFGSEQLAGLMSPQATTEEGYLLQKMIRQLGSPHIDHRLREIDTQDQAAFPTFPGVPFALPAFENFESVLLIGSHIRKEQPLAALRLRKAALKGALVSAINPVDYHFTFPMTYKEIVAPQHLLSTLKKLIHYLQSNEETASSLYKIAQSLKNKEKSCIVLGALALHHPKAAAIRYLVQQIAQLTNSQIAFMTDGPNSAGAWLAGVLPHRQPGGLPARQVGLSAYEMFKQQLKSYILLNMEPDLDCANGAQAIEALRQAKFVLALSSYRNVMLETYADIILPIAPFTETSGTYVNCTGVWQSFKGVAKGLGASRPAWKVLRVLANFLHLEGFDYESSEAIREELHAHLQTPTTLTATFPSIATEEASIALTRIGEIPLYAIDSLVRHAPPLQATQTMMEGDLNVAKLHPETAKRLGIQAGDIVSVTQSARITLPVLLDERIAQEAVWIAGGLSATSLLGDLIGEITLNRE